MVSEQTSPQPIAVACVIDGGQALIGRRPEHAVLGGYWEFPGGKIRPGETPAEAARRECLEETGLQVHVGQLLLETVHRYEHGALRLFFFEASPRPARQHPLGRFRWVRLADLPHYPFPPANGPMLARLASATGEDFDAAR
jgi:mutator protein MutT